MLLEGPGSERPLERLPLITLLLTERCNSRCAGCDYWRNGHADMTRSDVESLAPALRQLGAQVALISGGEPLINPEWPDIARVLRGHGLRLWLLTSGLALAKHAAAVAELFDAVTVSLDGATPETYRATRGIDAFDKVCEGIQSAAARGTAVGIRVTVQRANYLQLAELVGLATQLGARQISFVAADVSSQHAFGRDGRSLTDLRLSRDDLPRLAAALQRLQTERAAEFESGLILDSPRKLGRLYQYFAALLDAAELPPVRCNVYDYSVVIGARGRIDPCFFIPGPPQEARFDHLQEIVNDAPMRGLRAAIRAGRRPECSRCVCSLWREPDERSSGNFLMRQ